MKKNTININTEKLNSFIISLILMTPAIITLFNNLFQTNISTSSLILSLLICIFILISLFSSKSIKFNLMSFIFILLLCLIFVLSTLIRKNLNYSFLQFIFYIIISIILCQQKFNIKYSLSCILIISIPLIFGIDKMLVLNNVGLNQANMYNTYCFIPSIIAMMTYFTFFKKGRVIINIALLLNIYYLIKVIITATRGFWLVLGAYIFLLIYYMFQKKESHKRYYFILFISTILLIIIYININSIILFVLSIFEKIFGDKIGIIIKTQRLLEQGDILNGRHKLWMEIIKNIIKNPFTGYGFESTKYLTSGIYPYPHNFILQLLLDCGIVGIYPIFVVFKTIVLFFRKNINELEVKISLLFFISISVPIVSLSYDIWKYSAFWLLIGYGISLIERNKNNDTN